MANLTPKHSISVQASTKHLANVRDFVAKHASELGFKKQDVADIRLAVDEAYTNIIKHSYKNDPQKSVDIDLGYDEDKFWISLMDTGNAFDPSNYKKPDIEKSIKKGKKGGVGVYLIRKLMDEVTYSRQGSKNVIHMTKKRR